MSTVTLCLCIGALIGTITTRLLYSIRAEVGVLKVDHTNPERPVYWIEFKNIRSVNKLASIKRVVLTVDNEADLSHE